MDSITARVEWAYAIARERRFHPPRAQVLSYLAFRGASSYPSVAKIVEDTRLSLSTVKRELKGLDLEDGLLRREVPSPRDQARGKTVVYHLVIAGLYVDEAADAVGRAAPPAAKAAARAKSQHRRRGPNPVAVDQQLFERCQAEGLWRPGMGTLQMLDALRQHERRGKPTAASDL